MDLNKLSFTATLLSNGCTNSGKGPFVYEMTC